MQKSLIFATAMLAGGLLAVGAPRARAQDSGATPPPKTATPTMPAAIKVNGAAIAHSINDRMPVDTGRVFSDSVGELYAWTEIAGASGSTIHHVWYHGDEKVADVSIDVGGSPWRAWSKKTISADDDGAWRVEVTDPNGTVLKTLHFTIGKSAPMGTTQ